MQVVEAYDYLMLKGTCALECRNFNSVSAKEDVFVCMYGVVRVFICAKPITAVALTFLK